MPQERLTYLNFLHAVCAAGSIAKDERVIVFGSNAILPWLDQSMQIDTSNDVDITFFDDEDEKKTNKVDISLGELSLFHQTFGFWIHGVPIDESRFPKGWKERLVKIDDEERLEGKVAYVLSPSDLAAVKLAAGRDKDFQFIENLLYYNIVDDDTVRDSINLLPQRKEIALANLEICLIRYRKRIDEENSMTI